MTEDIPHDPRHRTSTEELRALDLVQYQIRQQEKGTVRVLESIDDLKNTISTLNLNMALFNQKIVSIEERQDDSSGLYTVLHQRVLVHDNDKTARAGLWGAITAIGVATAAFFSK